MNYYSGRATSAAPLYFKPYYHEPTRHTYEDGGVSRNNPVRVADEERLLIWRHGNNRPDIFLSIGSGIPPDWRKPSKPLKALVKSKSIRRIMPRGLKKNVSTIYEMIESITDCTREWEDFIAYHRADSHFVRVCHRLNVELQEYPPKLDEIDKMDGLKSRAQSYLAQYQPLNRYLDRNYRNAHAHIAAVARRLLASLFYFEPSATQNQGSQSPTTKLCRRSGYLNCRLSPTMKTQFASLLLEGLAFRVQDRDGTRDLADPTFDKETFRSNEIEFLLSNGDQSWSIEVQFHQRGNRWEPISGFS